MSNSTRKPSPLPSPAHDVVRFVDDDSFQAKYDAWKASQSGSVEIVDRDYVREPGEPARIYIYYRIVAKPISVVSGRTAITIRPPARNVS